MKFGQIVNIDTHAKKHDNTVYNVYNIIQSCTVYCDMLKSANKPCSWVDIQAPQPEGNSYYFLTITSREIVDI